MCVLILFCDFTSYILPAERRQNQVLPAPSPHGPEHDLSFLNMPSHSRCTAQTERHKLTNRQQTAPTVTWWPCMVSSRFKRQTKQKRKGWGKHASWHHLQQVSQAADFLMPAYNTASFVFCRDHHEPSALLWQHVIVDNKAITLLTSHLSIKHISKHLSWLNTHIYRSRRQPIRNDSDPFAYLNTICR